MRRYGTRGAIRLCSVAGLLFSLMLVLAPEARATHFRFGHITWKPTGQPNEVVFRVSNAWRRGGYPGSASDGSLAVGDTLQETIGFTTLFFGDGASTGLLMYKVDAINTVEDWVVAHAIDPSTGADWRHTYLNPGIYAAKIDSCCRTEVEINNPNRGYEVSTIVDLTIANQSPVSTVPPIVACPSGPCIFPLPGVDADLDNLSFRLSTPVEAGDLGFTHPGAGTANPLSVGPTGVLTWDSSSFPMGLYSTSITLEEQRGGSAIGKVMLDFLINTDEFLGVAPEFDVPPTLENAESVTIQGGQLWTQVIQCSDADPGDNVTMGHLGLPPGMTMVPPNATGNPAVALLSWTPVISQAVVVAFTCVDTLGNPALPHSNGIIVEGLEIPAGGPGNEDIFCDGLTIDQLISSGDYNVIDRRLFPPSLVIGTAGRDLMLGSGFGDQLVGGDGDDCIIGGVAPDFASGGDGDDQIFGWNGHDVLVGDNDNDEMFGYDGNDILIGGAGNDTLDGFDNEDVLLGGSGSDILVGGDDIDVLTGHEGNDELYGNLNDDILDGGPGIDLIDGDLGDDQCVADAADSPPHVGCAIELPASTAPTITGPAGDQSLDEGTTLSITITADDPQPMETLTFTATSLPSFATLTDNGDRTATLDLQPTAGDAGIYAGIILQVEDNEEEFPLSDYEIITITVTGGNNAPSIVDPGSQLVNEGETLALLIGADDADAEDMLAFSAVGLPSFATLTDHGDRTATLDVQPLTGDAGVYPGVLIRVTDDGIPVLDDYVVLTITIDGGNHAPVITTPIDNQIVAEGATVSLNIVADDADPGDTLTYASIDLPAFATLTDHGDRTATLEISPIDGDAGEYQGVVVVVTDDSVPPLSDSEIFIITVTDGVPTVFGQPVLASDANTFAWAVPADVIYVRGALDSVGTYAFDTAQPLTGATSLQDTSTPAPGEGLYYLVRADLPLASWQTSLGAEPARDVALP